MGEFYHLWCFKNIFLIGKIFSDASEQAQCLKNVPLNIPSEFSNVPKQPPTGFLAENLAFLKQIFNLS
jgi:hypothetical protein